jgi:hypothetical protein
VVWVIFDILEAWYGLTDDGRTFLINTYDRSILDLAIPFDSSVPLPPTIWLTAVKHESLSFFQRNKDPRAYIGKFWDLVRIRKIVWILVNGSCFFRFLPLGSPIWLNVPKTRIRFAGNDIRNYCLIFNTNSARDQKKIFVITLIFS